MFCRRSKNSSHVAAFGVSRAYAVSSISKSNISIDPEIDDYLGLSRKTMNMTRFVILRVSNESNIAEA